MWRMHPKQPSSASSLLIAFLLGVTPVASACAAARPTATVAIHPVATPTPADSTLELPLDAYAPTATELARQTYVLRRAEQRCMRGFGFDFFPGLSPQIALTVRTSHEIASRRYGVSDESIAATRGYHLSLQYAGTAAPQSVNSLPTAERLVLTGATAGTANSYHGKRIPAGGCLGAAQNTVLAGAGGSDDNSQLVASLDHQDFTAAMADSRVKGVFARWSACMKRRGYDYADPIAAVSDPRWNLDSSAPSHAEIQTALADIACKRSTNLLGVAFAVESDYQLADIARYSGALDQIKAQLDGEIRRVDQLWTQDGG